jgi:HAE1 family hydrophobic/amphiphilic exporter-1
MIRLSIRRPVAVAMTYLALALLGVAAWTNIPIELLPNTELPRLTIEASWPGASPETIEAFLTSPIESEVQQVRGVEKVLSESYEERGVGRARIEVEFNLDTDMDFARLDLSERLAVLEEDLPPGVGRVLVQPYVPEEFADQSGAAILTYTFTGPYTIEGLRDHLDEIIVPRLTQVEGVSVIRAMGGRDRLIQVELDEDRINALGLTPDDVARRLADLDLVREAGQVRDGGREWTVTIQNRPSSVLELREAVLLADQGEMVRVADVARVSDTFEEAYFYYRIDGRPAVAFEVIKEIGTNTVRVADAVKAAVAELEPRNPAGTRVILDDDQSEDIRRQLSDLRSRAIAAAVVIFLVLLGFLRSLRSAGVIFATIGFSVLIALNLIYFGGLTLNLLTLMGLAMGFGLIVDNSIVVLENVYRRWQGGEDGAEAAEAGAREVVLPILASTLTTLIVFVPFVYLQGELRVFYVPLAVVVGLTLLASIFVAFTFIPSLAARLLDLGPGRGGSGGTRRASGAGGDRPADPEAVPAGASAATTPAPDKVPLYVAFYEGLLTVSLRAPWLTVLVAAACLAGSFYTFDRYVVRGVVWGGRWGSETYISIQLRFPRGSGLERTDELTRHFEDRLRQMPEVDRFVSQVSANWGMIRVTFPEELEQTQVPVAIKEQLVAYSLGYSGAEVRVYGYGPSFYGGGGGAPNYSITVLGYNYERVREIAEDVGLRLSRISRVRDVDTNSSGAWFNRDRASEFVVTIDRRALSRYDMTVRELVQQLNAAVAGQVSQSNLKVGGEEIRYDVKLAGFEDMDLVALRNQLVTTPGGLRIRLGDVTRVESRELLTRIRREDQQYERTVAYEFRGPRKLGDLVHDAVIDATGVPPGYTVKKADSWRWTPEERSQIYLVVAVSILLIFMVTAALFESLRQPFCVLLTVPMALVGVFLIFFFTDASFTREAYVGVIMMGGIVVNNAILLVDHVNRLRREDALPLADAIVRGTLERVRPILMTTTTTVLGLLPLVLFAEAADANIWNALAFTLIGGLLSSTVFVLTVTPALYFLVERIGLPRRRWGGRWTSALSPAPTPSPAPAPGD